MDQAAFVVRVYGALKEAFTRAAKVRERTGPQPVRDLTSRPMARSACDHDSFFRTMVDRGLRYADDPHSRRIPHEEMVKKMKARLEGRILPESHVD